MTKHYEHSNGLIFARNTQGSGWKVLFPQLKLKNIEYTPAPDIIHEAAGHAPIIANPDYAEYLRRLGDIGSKAILSKHDLDVYEAVRKLSILKDYLNLL